MDWQLIEALRRSGWFASERGFPSVALISALSAVFAAVFQLVTIQVQLVEVSNAESVWSEVALVCSAAQLIVHLVIRFRLNRVLRMLEQGIGPDAAAVKGVWRVKVVSVMMAVLNLLMIVATAIIADSYISSIGGLIIGNAFFFSCGSAVINWAVCLDIAKLFAAPDAKRVTPAGSSSNLTNRHLGRADVDEMSASRWFKATSQWLWLPMLVPILSLVAIMVVVLVIVPLLVTLDGSRMSWDPLPVSSEGLVIAGIFAAIYCGGVAVFYAYYWVKVKRLFHLIEDRLPFDGRLFKSVTSVGPAMIVVYVLGFMMGVASAAIPAFSGGGPVVVFLGFLICVLCICSAGVGMLYSATASATSKVFGKPTGGAYSQGHSDGVPRATPYPPGQVPQPMSNQFPPPVASQFPQSVPSQFPQSVPSQFPDPPSGYPGQFGRE
jgi:hypothetical protein